MPTSLDLWWSHSVASLDAEGHEARRRSPPLLAKASRDRWLPPGDRIEEAISRTRLPHRTSSSAQGRRGPNFKFLFFFPFLALPIVRFLRFGS